MPTDGKEHHVSVCELSAVKDDQLLPNHPRWTPRRVPPGRSGAPHQFVLGQLVVAVHLQGVLHLRLPLLQGHQRWLMVLDVVVVVEKKLFGLGELLLQRQMLVSFFAEVVHGTAHALLFAFLRSERSLVEHVC